MKRRLPFWFPEHPPIYDIEKTYLENADYGPFYNGPFPERELPPESQWIDFLGFKIASPIGIAAGPLLNARWIAFAAKMGFDVVTYKTLRSREFEAHALPNMVYVDVPGLLKTGDEGGVVRVSKKPPNDMAHLAATNSFGMPSRDPDYLRADIAKAQKSLRPGQVMIVSVVGTPRPNEDFLDDFVVAAKLALEGGAEILEANFSCPNVVTGEGSLYSNPELVQLISSKILKAAKNAPLIIKVGTFRNPDDLRAVMKAAHNAGVSGLCGINTMSMQVIDESGEPALGKGRLRAGLVGAPIRQSAIDFVSMAAEINEKERFGLKILATGGVTDPAHFDLFFDAGADVAMTALGMMWDPFLAMRYHATKENKV